MKYALMWVTKDPQWIKDKKIFYTLMEMNVHMAINSKPQLLPSYFDKIEEYLKFKVDFDHILIREWKDRKQKWHELPYLVIADIIDMVLDS